MEMKCSSHIGRRKVCTGSFPSFPGKQSVGNSITLPALVHEVVIQWQKPALDESTSWSGVQQQVSAVVASVFASE